MMDRIQYTGTNYGEVSKFCGEGKLLAPYFCMGFSMLSLLTSRGYVSVNEGDYVVRDADGDFHVE